MMLVGANLTLSGRLADVSVSLNPGEVTVICGPNGAGKSSLLAALAGLIIPDHGAVTLDETPLSRLPATARAQTIGFLPQSADVAWDVTVETLAVLGRLPWRSSAATDATAVNAALAALQLDSLRDRPVSQLSGGERARALLARVLAGEPRWLLADEPLANLDLAHQLALLERMRKLARDRGLGVVLVLHDLAQAMNYADRVLVLDLGALVADGPPEAVLTEDLIRVVWGVPARWLGQPGARALLPG